MPAQICKRVLFGKRSWEAEAAQNHIETYSASFYSFLISYSLVSTWYYLQLRFYEELEVEMAAIHQQLVEAEMNECANALEELKRFCKVFGFTAGMLKDSLADGRKSDTHTFGRQSKREL